MSDPQRYEIPPDRLARWLDRWAEEHAPVERTEIRPGLVTFIGAEGAALEADPPFPPFAATSPACATASTRSRCSTTPHASAWSA